MLTEQPDGIGRLERAATAGVILLAAGSFVLSYDALHQLAVTNQVPRPLAWIWPLIVDGFIITASLAVLHAILTARSASHPWLLVLAFSATSITFNVLHPPPTAIARLVAAIPPLTRVLSFELLMRQLRDRLSDRGHQTAPPLYQAPGAAAITSSDTVTATATKRNWSELVSRSRAIHQQHLREGTILTGKRLGEMLGISDGYARRLLRGITANQTPS